MNITLARLSAFLCTFSVILFLACNSQEKKGEDQKIEASTKDSITAMKTQQPDSLEKYRSEITCPQCGHKKMEIMPTDVCVIRYTCENCKSTLHPKDGDCCVFCTYGSKLCPSMQ